MFMIICFLLEFINDNNHIIIKGINSNIGKIAEQTELSLAVVGYQSRRRITPNLKQSEYGVNNFKP